MKLLIVESPAKAKTVSKYLNGEYTVKASVGHIRDLPKSNKQAIDIPGGFIPHYEISKGKEHIVSEIKTLAKKATEVVLATDPDREGEAIAWHIKEAIGLKNPKRVAFHEITKDAVREAMEHPREIDENLRQAQEARRVLDRLVGYDLSGLIWKKVRYGLSAGRVQSPALRIIMEREREIRAFIPVTYWDIEADLKTASSAVITFACSKQPHEKETTETIVSKAKAGAWRVVDVNETEAKRSPRPPFTTSTLQQSASSRLGYAPSRTMQIAQKLYEAGHISYMRTDSTNLSKQAIDQISSIIESKYGKENLHVRTYATKSKNAQEAHEAIRPSDCTKQTVSGTPEQLRLYELIWQRAISSQMEDAKLLRTKIVANIATDDIPPFWANGSRVISAGWLLADTESRGEDVELPAVKAGDNMSLIDLRSTEKQTEPPSRYTEAGLIKELEKRDIGRPSTYASIIKTLQDRDYVIKDGKAMKPTDTGEVVSDFLEQNFGAYISDTFTAKMEDDLDEIANGKASYLDTLRNFYGPFLKEVKLKEKSEKVNNLGEADPIHICPKCKGSMVIKLGKSGKFLSCKNYPDCDGARTIEGKELEGPKETGEKCPKCETGSLVQRQGKFGIFVACSNYPKCKFIKTDPEEEKRRNTGVVCNLCKKGTMVEKRGRFGFFYSCSSYPDCKNIIKTRPTGNTCPVCQSLMMEGTKTIPERCSNKMCKNHNPHKTENETPPQPTTAS
jgi:DNA topoisomerase-1